MTPEENQEDVPSPVRVYLNDGGMTVHLFFEGHPDHVTDTNIIDVTLYAIGEASGISRSLAGSDAAAATPSFTAVQEYCDAFAGVYQSVVSKKTFRESS